MHLFIDGTYCCPGCKEGAQAHAVVIKLNFIVGTELSSFVPKRAQLKFYVG